MQQEGYDLSLHALRDLAQRSGLMVADDRLEQLAGQLLGILQTVHRLDDLDLKGFEPATALHVWQE